MLVIRRLDTIECKSHIGSALNLATSTHTTRTILNNEEKILLSATATTTSFATRITHFRTIAMYEMDNRLSIWIDDEIERNMPLCQSTFLMKRQKIGNTEETE
ncbi:hypothetical protein TNCV_1681021 [Trichonephila clavipes]|nr:hypothetical protein TNCV_1681021 [Trichonephila clavipes]